MRRTLAMAFLALGSPAALGAVGVAGVGAQPIVRVQAESRIELRTRRIGTAEAGVGVVIEGALRDDLGEPLAGRLVTLRVDSDDGRQSLRIPLTTDARGEIRVEPQLPIGGYVLRAHFRGDDGYQSVEAERRLDLERSDVRLRVTVPSAGRLDLDLPEHAVQVLADSADGGAGLRVDLLDELDRPLARGRTDVDGRVSFALPSRSLGAPGAGRLKARSEADATRAEAQTEVPIVRFRRTQLTLLLRSGGAPSAPGDVVRFAGRLSDRTGPLEGKAVGLFGRGAGLAEEAHLATSLTDVRGELVAEVTVPAGTRGTLQVVARFDSDTPGRTSSESPPVPLEVIGAEAAGSTPWLWLILPMSLCALVLLVIARRTPKRIEKTAPAPVVRPAGIEASSRRGLLAERTEIAGVVLDARDDEPLRGARVELTRADGAPPRTATTDDEGRFAIDALEIGRWSLRIEREGFAPELATVNAPHRGEWSAVRIRLASLRTVAIDRYRPVALAVLPSARELGVWTAREILSRARARGADAIAMGDLTARVEKAAYAEVPPTVDDVAAIGAIAAQIRSELPRDRTGANGGAPPAGNGGARSSDDDR